MITLYSSVTTAEFSNIMFQQKSAGTSYNISLVKGNWAFIDMQNLYKGVRERGWKINWKRFREYLATHYNITRAIVFMGYIRKYECLYSVIRSAGFEIEFREVNELCDGTIDGGNVDADLAYYVMDNKAHYNRALVVADDGDYSKMLQSLLRQDKLELVISSHSIKQTSEFIKAVLPRHLLLSINSIRNIIE